MWVLSMDEPGLGSCLKATRRSAQATPRPRQASGLTVAVSKERLVEHLDGFSIAILERPPQLTP